MGTVNFEFGTLIQGGQNKMGVFDADIDPFVRNGTTNADLSVFVRICFQKVDPTPASSTYNDWDGTAVPIRKWRSDEWANWKRRFINDCNGAWHGKFWLVTPRAYNSLNWPEQNPTHRCNLWCRFEMTETASPNGAHAVIPVVRVNGNHSFRSHMLLYSNRDLRPERLTRGSLFYTHIHEIGHLIGLDHPGTGLPGCRTGGEHVCYAGADGNDRDVMGRGSHIYPRHAQPWIKA